MGRNPRMLVLFFTSGDSYFIKPSQQTIRVQYTKDLAIPEEVSTPNCVRNTERIM